MKLLAILFPLLLGLAAFGGGRAGAWAARLTPLAALPALWLALFPGPAMALEGVLLGLKLEVAPEARPLLLLSGLVAGLSGWYAQARIRERRGSFFGFWLLTLSGLHLAMLAGDLAGFYLGYTTFSLAAWGLVIHNRDREALRAGRAYLVLALVSEALILAGLLQLAAAVGNASFTELGPALETAVLPGWTFWVLLAGFGIKLGAAPLHFWLPLAHAFAPGPASVALSGVMVKAGLLGLVRFLDPQGFPGAAAAADGLIALGLGGCLVAAIYGLGQHRLKVILAYSTVSQMGLLLAAFTLTLHHPEIRTAALPLLGLLVLHHGLNKAALFTAAGCSPGASRLRLALLALPALSLAGLPLLAGFAAKGVLKYSLPEWSQGLVVLTSLTTALLMIHLLLRARAEAAAQQTPAILHPSWPVLAALGLAVPWWWALDQGLAVDFGASALWDGTWPALLAIVLALAWAKIRGGAPPRLPAGDLLVPFEAGARQAVLLWTRLHPPRPEVELPDPPSRIAPLIARSEAWLRNLPALGAVLLGLTALVWWLL